MVGTRVGDYQVLRPLGKGGMSDVYAARDLSLDRDVALKVLRADLARDKDYVARFRREARAAAKLNHPNIVGVYEVGSIDSTHFIAQELIDGKNLRQHLEQVGQISPEMAVEILLAVGGALEVASEWGITHRDIKPENIMVGMRGEIKVADFGLARLNVDTDVSQTGLTQAGFALGTPRYMSPEQVQGKPVDARSDLYSLGVTMYHLLAGRPPFDSEDPLALAYSHLNETPKPLDRARGNDDVPDWLIAIVSKLSQKNPASRFQSPSELLDTLRGDSSQSSYGVGTSSATVLLQRAADAAKSRRRTRLFRYAATFALPAAAFLGGLFLFAPKGFFDAGQRSEVSRMLRPDQVREAENVDRQFLIAHSRDDVAGWEAVWDYFPPEDGATHQEYAVKAKLQLARLHEKEKRFRDAIRVAESVLNSDADLRFRVLAAARRVSSLEKDGRPDALVAAKSEYTGLYKQLRAENPNAIEWFNRIVPDQQRAALEVVASGET